MKLIKVYLVEKLEENGELRDLVLGYTTSNKLAKEIKANLRKNTSNLIFIWSERGYNRNRWQFNDKKNEDTLIKCN